MYSFITLLFMGLGFIIGYNSSVIVSYFGMIVGSFVLVCCHIGCYKSIEEVKKSEGS